MASALNLFMSAGFKKSGDMGNMQARQTKLLYFCGVKNKGDMLELKLPLINLQILELWKKIIYPLGILFRLGPNSF